MNDTMEAIRSHVKTLANDQEFGKSMSLNSSPSVEYPGYLSTFHETPDDLDAAYWCKVVKQYHLEIGGIVLHALAALKPKPGYDWYEDYDKKDTHIHGIEIIWRTSQWL